MEFTLLTQWLPLHVFLAYYLSGSNSVIYHAPGKWNQETPQCIEGKEKSCYSAKLYVCSYPPNAP